MWRQARCAAHGARSEALEDYSGTHTARALRSSLSSGVLASLRLMPVFSPDTSALNAAENGQVPPPRLRLRPLDHAAPPATAGPCWLLRGGVATILRHFSLEPSMTAER
jgi:hypothetical protein